MLRFCSIITVHIRCLWFRVIFHCCRTYRNRTGCNIDTCCRINVRKGHIEGLAIVSNIVIDKWYRNSNTWGSSRDNSTTVCCCIICSRRSSSIWSRIVKSYISGRTARITTGIFKPYGKGHRSIIFVDNSIINYQYWICCTMNGHLKSTRYCITIVVGNSIGQVFCQCITIV